MKLNIPASFCAHAMELVQIFGMEGQRGIREDNDNYLFKPLIQKTYSEELTKSVMNYRGSFSSDGIPKDTVSGVTWPVVSNDFGTPNYMYFSQPKPKYMGQPGPLLSSATKEDCNFGIATH